MTDDVRARLDALHARVHPPDRRTPVTPDPGAALDAAVERVLAERDRRQAEAAARAERDRAEALATGGPCRDCGITQSWERDRESDRAVGRWYGSRCAWCEGDAAWDIAGRTDAEHRLVVLKRLLTTEQLAGWGSGAAEQAGFRWWHETPGAVTSETERFRYVDREALAARLAPKPIAFATREPCERCGCAQLWFLGTGYIDLDPSHGSVSTWSCHGCGRFPELVDVIVWATGLTKVSVDSLGVAVEQVLGVRWWRDDPAGGAADPPRPNAVPFGYVDRQAARRRAFEVFGRGDWAALRFIGPDAFEAAREAAS